MKKDVNINIDANKIATNLIEDAIKLAWDKVKCFFKDIGKKDAIDYRDAYEEYLKNTKERYCKIKTIIYRKVPKDIYSFYECIGVDYNNATIDTSNVNNLLSISHRLIITGTGGIGKSMLLKHLYLNSISETNHIPVLIELRNFNNYENEKINIYEQIYSELLNNGFDLEKKYFDYSLCEGAYIFLFDGYDEINRIKKSKVDSEIKSFCNKFNNNSFILSSRPSEEFIGWNNFTELTANNMTKNQALSLIKKIDFDDKIKQSFYEELDSTLFEKYQSFASNPLLLNIMLLTFNNNARIPDNLSDFYEQAFTTLFNMHDATKDAYVRDIRTGLGCEDFKLIFSHICFNSYFKGDFEFTERKLRSYIKNAQEKHNTLIFKIDDYKIDLTSSVCMLVKEGLNYRFSHRSFQEYFAALYTCKLTDDVQQALLTEYFKSAHILSDMYLKLLFTMQPDKVNKIILSPGIEKIKENYNDEGFNIKFLKTLFNGIGCISFKSKKEPTIRLLIKNNYLCNILSVTCMLNNYKETNSTHINNNLLINEIDSLQKKSKKRYANFDEISPQLTSTLLEELKWIKNRIEFAILIFDKYKKEIDTTNIESILKSI